MPSPTKPPGQRLELEVRLAGRLSENEVDTVTALIVDAFGDDPFGRHLVGNDPSLIPLQFRSVIAAANVGGTILLGTAKNVPGENEIAGCLIAFGPGQSLNSTEEQRVAGWHPFVEKVDEYTKGWWEDYWIPLLEKTCDSSFGEEGALRSWDIQLLGVRPEYTGKGVASKLMRHVLALADAENAPTILETQNEKNVAMYTKMGFEAKDLIHVESSRVKTSPFWFMRRGF